MNKLLSISLLCAIGLGCARNSETEKYQNSRDNIVNVRENIKEITTGDVYIGSVAVPRIIGDYLFIRDVQSSDELIRIFDKNNFDYVTSIAHKGQGPGEITNIGHIVANDAEGKFYVSDHGKLNIFSYDLDSALADAAYMPGVKFKMNKKIFPANYYYINDSLCIGSIIEPVGNNDFNETMGKWNIITGEAVPMKYTNPDITKKRISFAVSEEHGIYAEVYSRYDLITICTLDGELKYNIYGPNWERSRESRKHYNGYVESYNDKIIVAYSGGSWDTDDYYPTKFLVFDINGDYIKTLDVGHKFYFFCIDRDNNRIIMSLKDIIQFAYLDLDGLI